MKRDLSQCHPPCVLTFWILMAFFAAQPIVGQVVVGGNRPVQVHVPPGYDPEVPTPLIVAIHGFNPNNYIDAYLLLTALADERGFLAVYPNGTFTSPGGSRFWNATPGCCNFNPNGVDDSGYLRGVIEETSTVLNVDERRIYVTGHSNGGFMSHRMACDHADILAGIASWAGSTYANPSQCNPTEPVHILHVHATDDGSIRYNGTGSYPSAVDAVALWAGLNECSSELEDFEERLDLDNAIAGRETSIRRHADCRPGGSAELWTMEGSVHSPGLIRKGSSTALARRIVDWFLAHPKSPVPLAAFDAAVAEISSPR